jgi:hypothetical protein
MKSKSFFSFALLLFAAAVLFMACPIEDSSDVNQDKIYTDYEVFYNSNTDKSIVLAKFRFGGATGTLLELTEPAEVYFNEDKLPFQRLNGGHYKEYAGRITEGTFSYTNIDSVTYTNELPDGEEIDFPEDLDSLSRSESYTFEWQGTPLKENQSVGVFVGSWTWGQDALFFQNNLGATNIVMGIDKLGNLPLGGSTWYLDRSTQEQLTEGTGEGGFIRTRYRARNIEVMVTE